MATAATRAAKVNYMENNSEGTWDGEWTEDYADIESHLQIDDVTKRWKSVLGRSRGPHLPHEVTLPDE
jgi:hypothetical protein